MLIKEVLRYLVIGTLAATLAGCAIIPQSSCYDCGTLDYADPNNWLLYQNQPLPAQNIVTDSHHEWLKSNPDPKVDVFFIHPTTEVLSKAMNSPVPYHQRAQYYTKHLINYQEMAFAGAARIFAPYYHQLSFSHIVRLYYSLRFDQDQATAVAYQDVLAAFNYYIAHENHGRGFILAGHSQGSMLLQKLLHERIDNTPLAKQLVAAYLIGGGNIISDTNHYQDIHFCQNASDTQCIIGWNTYRVDQNATLKPTHALCTNPLTWEVNGGPPGAENNQGAWISSIEPQLLPHFVDAYCSGGRLMVDLRLRKLREAQVDPGVLRHQAFWQNSFHLFDYAFFYKNIWDNVITRTQAYLSKTSQ